MNIRSWDFWARILMVLAVAAIIVGMGAAYFTAKYRALVAEQRSSTRQVANDLELHFNGRLLALKLLATDPDIRSLDPDRAQPKLAQAMKVLDCYRIAIADPQGNVVVNGRDEPAQVHDLDSFFAAARGRPVISDRIIFAGLSDAFVSLRVPVYDDHDKVIAVLLAGVSLDEVAKTAGAVPVKAKHYIFVIDSVGRLLCHPRINEIYPEKPDFTVNGKLVFAPDDGYVITQSYLDGIEKLFVFTNVKNTGWRVVMATPIMDVYAAILRDSLPDIGLFGLIMLSLGLGYGRLRQARRYRELVEAVRLERLASVGQLAAGIAHEIRNPLTSVKGFIQLIMARGDRPVPRDYLEIILTEIERIEKLIREFHLLARPPQTPQFALLNLRVVLHDVVLLMESQALSKNVALEFMPGEDVTVCGDVSQLKQVWINLLRNAIEAAPQGGSVDIALRADGNWAVVTVTDNGPGIPEDILPHLGTPFFTTKQDGTGLGLSVCYSIVQNHGGNIRVNSRPGEGATFTVQLPLADNTAHISATTGRKTKGGLAK
ncbi:histidine kinase [Thermosinus carboxydivorans Nor1]|uniref:histidine kinase n=1 Tax=Thermosinus carboxydivorans Nor1 TaxID=401526 RepID=A1HQD9_9FIRM|nr:PAS domain-containing sensor histidine kinase [Thermosinus carboxydivorans]EAX47746.1 histidine kinase [Thermosinus carboxydivorans Nor1]